MDFLATDNVEVFPSALRQHGLGNYTTENNISNLIRMTTSNNSFVDEYKERGSNYDLTIVIHGYTFKLTNVNPSNNYACIRVDNNGMLVEYDNGGTELDMDVANGHNITRTCKCIAFIASLDDNWVSNRGEYVKTVTDENTNNISAYYYALQFYDGKKIINTDKTSVSSLEGGPFGSDTQPIYIDSSGAPQPCTKVAAKTSESLTTANVGSAMVVDSTTGIGSAIAEPVFIDSNGKPVSSNLKIIISKEEPSGVLLTENLIWLKPMT